MEKLVLIASATGFVYIQLGVLIDEKLSEISLIILSVAG